MPESRTSQLARGLGAALLVFSVALWAGTTLCFLGRWDQVAAVTVLPQWAWASMGTLSAVMAWRLRQEHLPVSGMIIILWLLATVCFADNLLPLIRGLFHGSACKRPHQNGTLRIVTLNCASSPLAAAEVMKFHPDIVLLQESPPANIIAELARAWYGNSASFVAGLDCAIVSHYPLKAMEDRAPNHYRHAIATISSSREVLVTSLRLTPPLGRVDLWNPAIWHAYLRSSR